MLLGLPATAGAHAQLLRAEPADGTTVAQAPTALRLAFSEPVVASRSSLDLYAADGRHWRLTSRLAGATLTGFGADARRRWLPARLAFAVGGRSPCGRRRGGVRRGRSGARPGPATRGGAAPAAAETLLRWTALALLALLQGVAGAAAARRAGAGVGRARGGGRSGRRHRSAGRARGAHRRLAGRGGDERRRTGGGHARPRSRRRGSARAAAAGARARRRRRRRRPASRSGPTPPRSARSRRCSSPCTSRARRRGPAPSSPRRSPSGAAPAPGLLRRLAPVLAPCVAGLAITGLLELGRHVATVDALLTTTYGRLILLKTGLFRRRRRARPRHTPGAPPRRRSPAVAVRARGGSHPRAGARCRRRDGRRRPGAGTAVLHGRPARVGARDAPGRRPARDGRSAAEPAGGELRCDPDDPDAPSGARADHRRPGRAGGPGRGGRRDRRRQLAGRGCRACAPGQPADPDRCHATGAAGACRRRLGRRRCSPERPRRSCRGGGWRRSRRVSRSRRPACRCCSWPGRAAASGRHWRWSCWASFPASAAAGTATDVSVIVTVAPGAPVATAPTLAAGAGGTGSNGRCASGWIGAARHCGAS